MNRYRYKRGKKPEKKKNIRILTSPFFWYSLLAAFGLSGFLYFFIFSQFFSIKQISVSGNEKISSEEIKKTIDEFTKKRILFLEVRNIFLAKLKESEARALSDFPRIYSILIKRRLPSSLEVIIKERKEVALWCKDICFQIDVLGVIFETSSQNAQALVIVPQGASNEFALGEKAVSEEYMSAILEIKKSLEGGGIAIDKFLSEERARKITVLTKDGWLIYFGSDLNAKDQAFNLFLVLKEEILPEKRGDIEYVDLRFGSKVFYRYRQ